MYLRTKCAYCGKTIWVSIPNGKTANINSCTCNDCIPENSPARNGIEESIYTEHPVAYKIRKEREMAMQADVESVYKFGDVLNYKSPLKKNLKTKCLFIRKEGYKAVVMFENANFAARVGFNYLEKVKRI